MSVEKLSDSKVSDIFRLAAEDYNAARIARELGIPRLQIAAILAHQRLRLSDASQTPTEASSELIEDHWSKSEPPEVLRAEPAKLDSKPEKGLPRGIYVGEDAEFNTPVQWEPTNTREVQNPHLMIMGESGSGKTYAAQCLVAELAQRGIPTIIFDYGQSFESDGLERTFVKYCVPKEYLVGEDGLALNPFEIFPQDIRGPSTVATRLSDVFDAAFRLGDIQKKVFIEAALNAYNRAGIMPDDRETWRKTPPDLAAFSQAIEDLARDRDGYSNYRNAAGLSARLTPFFMLVCLQSKAWSWNALIDDKASPVHVIQFRGLEGKTRRVLVELLLWHMFFHFKRIGQGALRLFCVLDEAHHLSFRDGGPMDALLREARKFGLGIIFASQQPQDFGPVAYSNTASKLVFQTADPDRKVSKFLAAKCQNYDTADEIHEIIASLEQGQAFFITRNRGYTIKVSDLPKRATQWNG